MYLISQRILPICISLRYSEIHKICLNAYLNNLHLIYCPFMRCPSDLPSYLRCVMSSDLFKYMHIRCARFIHLCIRNRLDSKLKLLPREHWCILSSAIMSLSKAGLSSAIKPWAPAMSPVPHIVALWFLW